MTREEIIEMAKEAGGSSDDPSDLLTIGILERFAALVEERTLTKQKARYWQEGYEAGGAAERSKLAAWMFQFGFATSHSDTMDQLVDALGSEIVDRIECEVAAEREACARICNEAFEYGQTEWGDGAWIVADRIRARGES